MCGKPTGSRSDDRLPVTLCKGFDGLQRLTKQPVPGAVPEQHPVPPPGQADLKIPLGPPLDHRDLISGDQGGEREVVVLLHGVGGGEVPIVLHLLHGQPVVLVGLLERKGLQLSAAAGEAGGSRGGHQIAALGTDIEFQLTHTSSIRLPLLQLPGQQPLHGDAKGLGQHGQEGHVGAAQARFP